MQKYSIGNPLYFAYSPLRHDIQFDVIVNLSLNVTMRHGKYRAHEFMPTAPETTHISGVSCFI